MGNLLQAIRKGVLGPIDTRSGWSNIIREPSTGAWQRNGEISVDTVTSQHAVYACVTRISNDMGKLRLRLLQEDEDGIWNVVTNPAYSPVLRRPNRYQNYIQFKEWWTTSKLLRGNVYVLKQRDNRGVVVALYILDPDRVTPMVTDSGDIYYQLGGDNLSGVEQAGVVVPASEIIHDRMNCLFHPLVGISPLFASALAAGQSINMQRDAATFFANGSRPGGILTAPGEIDDATAKRLKEYFDENFAGSNRGKIAVLGDDLKYTALRMSAKESEVVEQFNWTATVVCSTFGVPPFKVQLGTLPAGMKVSDINLLYYTDCLQSHIEQMEVCLDEGLGLGQQYETNLDVDGLMRMDAGLQMEILTGYAKGGILAPNEARKTINRKPLTGGNSVYLQQQNFSMEALAARDAAGPPPNTLNSTAPAPAPAATPAPSPAPSDPDAQTERQMREFFAELKKGLTHA